MGIWGIWSILGYRGYMGYREYMGIWRYRERYMEYIWRYEGIQVI